MRGNRPRFPGRLRSRRHVRFAVALTVAGLLSTLAAKGQVIGFGRVKAARRQPAPAAENLPATDILEADAFALLAGPRPDFDRISRATPTTKPTAPAGEQNSWSDLVSGAILADEVKRCLGPLQEATASQTAFNGGVASALDRFSLVAVAFGLMADYDKPNDIRSSWRAAAAGLRDRFARVASHCDRDGLRAFPEARSRTSDLESLIRGETIDAEPEPQSSFQWSQLCDRAVLMRRLEAADTALARSTASADTFADEPEAVLHEAEIVAALGRLIVQETFVDWDDETYRGYAETMQREAKTLRKAVNEGDYDTARIAAKAVSQACSTCHEDYR